MSDRELNIRLTATDQTSAAISSAERQLDQLSAKANATASNVQRAVSAPAANAGSIPGQFYNQSLARQGVINGVDNRNVYNAFGWGDNSLLAAGGSVGGVSNYWINTVSPYERPRNNPAVANRSNVQNAHDAPPRTHDPYTGAPIPQSSNPANGMGQPNTTWHDGFGNAAVGGAAGAAAYGKFAGWNTGPTTLWGKVSAGARGIAGSVGDTLGKSKILSGIGRAGKFVGSQLFNKFTGAMIGAEIIYAGYEHTKNTINEWEKLADAQRELGRAIKAAGDSSQETLRETISRADSIAREFKTNETRVVENMTLYSGITGATGKELESAAVAAIGLGQQYKLDDETAIRLLAKAKMGHTEALGRYGISPKGKTDAERYKNLLTSSYNSAYRRMKPQDDVQRMMHEFGESLEDIGVGALNWWNRLGKYDTAMKSDAEIQRLNDEGWLGQMNREHKAVLERERRKTNWGLFTSSLSSGISSLPSHLSKLFTYDERTRGLTDIDAHLQALGKQKIAPLMSTLSGLISGDTSKLRWSEIGRLEQRQNALTSLYSPEQQALLDVNQQIAMAKPDSPVYQKLIQQREQMRNAKRQLHYQVVGGAAYAQFQGMREEAEQYRNDPGSAYADRMALRQQGINQWTSQYSMNPIAGRLMELKDALKSARRLETPTDDIRRLYKSTIRDATQSNLSAQLSILQSQASPLATYAPTIESRFLRGTPREANPLTIIADNQKEQNKIIAKLNKFQADQLQELKAINKKLTDADKEGI